MYESIVDAVLQNAVAFPDKLAVVDEKIAYSYAELSDAVKRVANWLIIKNVDCRDKILVECTQNTMFLVIDLACEYVGAVFVPLEKDAAKERVKGIFEETDAKFILGTKDYSDIGTYYDICDIQGVTKIKRGQSAHKHQVAEILFSTGTTGKPKGIVISNMANVAIAENICEGVKMTSDTIELVPLPLSHSHGLRTCYANLLNGSTVVLMDGVINIRLFFELMEKWRINAIDISPTLMRLLLRIARKGLLKYADAIHYIELGTAFLDENTKEQIKTIFKKSRLYNFYGSTEAGRNCVLDFSCFDAPNCIGVPAYNAQIRIVDYDRRPLHSTKENCGLLAVSGKMMMDGYLNDRKLTEETLVDGILYTSDMGYIDENGYVYVLGRVDDIINYRGIKIAPEEIEKEAAKYMGVADCACVAIEDTVCGQVPKLFIVLEEDTSFVEEAFRSFLKEHLEANRMPKNIEIIQEIPRTSNGKILRRRLRDKV